MRCSGNSGAGPRYIRAVSKLGMSARAHDRVLKMARTIADLDATDSIRESDLAEAIQYRGLDRPV